MIKIFVSAVVRDGERILLVQEGTEGSYGKWNLPGGHLEVGETLRQGVVREVREETRLEIAPDGLLGSYTLLRREEGEIRWQAVRFVFLAPHPGAEPAAGDEILAVRWFTLDEVAALTERELIAPKTISDVLARLRAGVAHSLDVLQEPEAF